MSTDIHERNRYWSNYVYSAQRGDKESTEEWEKRMRAVIALYRSGK